jgi:hypothetical protein
MPTTARWNLPAELSANEKRLTKVLARIGKFYVFLREIRHELFDEGFQAELSQAYKPQGRQPLPAALLATVTLLQAYDKIGDAEAVIMAQVDKRWQLVLGCLGAEEAPFSQGVLSQFRDRMIAHDLDKKLLHRTVELAKKSGKFGWQNLKATLDSSPLLGAGRVLDTWNLIGRALSTVVTCAARVTGLKREQVIAEAKLILSTAPSLKTALDIDWDDHAQRSEALRRLLGEVERVEKWVADHAAEQAATPPLKEALGALHRVLEQDLEPDPTSGEKRIRRGVAKDRMPSVGDPEMRHGRKSKNKTFNGYKRHLLKLIGADVTIAAEVLPANQSDQEALPALVDEIAKHGKLEQLLSDRGYLGSARIGQLVAAGVNVRCKPWPSRNNGRFTKEDFDLRLKDGVVVCPANIVAPISEKLVARFPAAACAVCSKRERCTTANGKGRTVTIHPQEALLVRLRKEMKTDTGREALRERTTIEHSLARLGRIQGPRARYKGIRKNALDVRRCATVDNLQTLARLRQAA